MAPCLLHQKMARIAAMPARRVFALLALALATSLLLAPVASARPATTSHATVAKKAKACKKRKHETKKHWLKRCKCAKFKGAETKAKFRKRCPGAKVPTRAPAPAPAPAPGSTPPTTGPLTGQAAIDKVTQGLTGSKLQYFTYSQTSGSSEDERYQFCTGTFSYTRNRVGLSGLAYDTNATGNWRIVSANVNADQISGSAVLHYDLTSYNSNDVDPAPPSSADVQLGFAGDKVTVNGRQYDATRPGC
jgi:hypothetical protein